MKNNFVFVKLGAIIECLDHKRIPLNYSDRKKMHGDIPYYGANGMLDYVNSNIFNEKPLSLSEHKPLQKTTTTNKTPQTDTRTDQYAEQKQDRSLGHLL